MKTDFILLGFLRNGINAEINNVSTVQEEDTFKLDGMKLKVLAVPGHTPSSIYLLDEKNESLFSGDSIQATPISMHLEISPHLSTYFK